mmetsp:Transcript_9916/g.11345  ORF Transcript_9916/g.11345 Transcript_9916/m.11345 type:complete len:81 (+) Transcript_9916:614-856(+)
MLDRALQNYWKEAHWEYTHKMCSSKTFQGHEVQASQGTTSWSFQKVLQHVERKIRIKVIEVATLKQYCDELGGINHWNTL